MSYEINSAVELSSEELDLVAGGADVNDARFAAFTSAPQLLIGQTSASGLGAQTGTLFTQNPTSSFAAENFTAHS